MSAACNFDEEPERKQLISDDRADLLVARDADAERYLQLSATGDRLRQERILAEKQAEREALLDVLSVAREALDRGINPAMWSALRHACERAEKLVGER